MDAANAARVSVHDSRKVGHILKRIGPVQLNRDFQFDIHDVCSLKSDPALVGHVVRTHCELHDRQPLAGLLILSYTSVPKADETEFLQSGVPPKGYVLVGFPEPSQGLGLIHEDDLILVDRALTLGQNVKRHANDTESGTVISVSVSCSLEPVAWRPLDPATGEYGPLRFTDQPIPRDGPKPDGSKPPQVLDVPQSELVNYEEFSEGDYIIYRQKVGVIHAVERDAVILLDDKKPVSLSDPTSLYVPVYNDPAKVVALHTNPSAMPIRPLTNGGFIWTSRSSMTFPGQYAFTTTNDMTRAERASLGYGPGSTPQGHVLATPPMDIHVDWLCPNVFAVGLPYTGANTEILRASALQGNAIKCDFGLLPDDNPNQTLVKPDSGLRIGDRVRFRDPKAAAAKYPSYQQIPTDESYGHDINILRIASTQTEVTVQWQDGSVTIEHTASLHRFSGTDDEYWPGNIVLLKDGVETSHPSASVPDSHEICETLRARKVGVIQTVNSWERVASVRWYKHPDIQLPHRGSMLQTGSRLGDLDDVVTDVSFYELTTYSCMKRKLDDLVILAPETIHQSVMATSSPAPPFSTGPCHMSMLSPVSFFEVFLYLEAMKMSLLSLDWFRESAKLDTTPLPSRYSVHHDGLNAKGPIDFIGKIVSIGSNGMVTVRLLDARNCRDIIVPFERIMMVLDDDYMSPWPFPPLDMLSPDGPTPPGFDIIGLGIGSTPFSDIDDELSAVLEDDEWVTEDDEDYEDYDELDDEFDEEELPGLMDTDEDHPPPEVSEIAPPDATEPERVQEKEFTECKECDSKGDDAGSILASHLPTSPPPGFAVLDTLPPPDHHFLSTSSPGTTGPWFKRLQKEFGILQSSLPPGIFVRVWESRVDLARVLIFGPQGTPYEHAPFMFDLYFQASFPNAPPTVHFHSWTNRQGQINPNLYEDGKICLSILGTWPTANPEESWSPTRSTVLQILVSIMGLVLVKAPFYNEAGYDALAAEDKKRIESHQYTEKTFLVTRRFIQHALEHPVKGMEDVLAWHYLPVGAPGDDKKSPRLLRRTIEDALSMIEHHNRTSAGEEEGEDDVASGFVSRLSLGAIVMLRKHIRALEDIESGFVGRESS
ncbi:hypothetical protein HFD88_004482 [Aspergillus terreus]|nr:hypothetical protein HFD88_004482 [Aspergillus terreus]